MRQQSRETDMLKHTILRLIRGGKATEGATQPDLPPVRTSSEGESSKDYRTRSAGLADSALNSLLDDYDMAVGSLRRWQASNHPHAAERVLEYRNLVVEIEAEIHAILDRAAR
jgi:hypothetical protein